MKLIPFKEKLLVAILISALSLFGNEGMASNSSTGVRPLPRDPGIWIVTLSKYSVNMLVETNSDQNLVATLRNLAAAFESLSGAESVSAGFHWSSDEAENKCEVFLLRNRDLDKSRKIAVIEYDDGDTCSGNATALFNAASRIRIAQHCQIQSTCAEIPPKLLTAFVERLAFDNIYQDLDSLSAWQHFVPSGAGYTVKAGDTLEKIAIELTGSASNSRELKVRHPTGGFREDQPEIVFPNDKVFFSANLSSRYLPILFPGQIEPLDASVPHGEGLDDIAKYIPSDDFEIIEPIVAANMNTFGTMIEFPAQNINVSLWIPGIMSGWKEVKVSEADLTSISKQEYGSEIYAPLIASICPIDVVSDLESCVIPIFEAPGIESDVWQWVLTVWKELQGKLDEQ